MITKGDNSLGSQPKKLTSKLFFIVALVFAILLPAGVGVILAHSQAGFLPRSIEWVAPEDSPFIGSFETYFIGCESAVNRSDEIAAVQNYLTDEWSARQIGLEGLTNSVLIDGALGMHYTPAELPSTVTHWIMLPNGLCHLLIVEWIGGLIVISDQKSSLSASLERLDTLSGLELPERVTPEYLNRLSERKGLEGIVAYQQVALLGDGVYLQRRVYSFMEGIGQESQEHFEIVIRRGDLSEAFRYSGKNFIAPDGQRLTRWYERDMQSFGEFLERSDMHRKTLSDMVGFGQ